MNISELLIPELERETKLTETFLNRVPKDKLEWKPHDRSLGLEQLALHITTLPGAIAELSAQHLSVQKIR